MSHSGSFSKLKFFLIGEQVRQSTCRSKLYNLKTCMSDIRIPITGAIAAIQGRAAHYTESDFVGQKNSSL